MSERSSRLHWSVTLGVTLAADLLLFPVLIAVLEAPLLSRSASLLIAYVLSQLLRLGSGLGKSPAAIVHVPGLWPLLVITVLINLGLFGILNGRAPEIQPLLHMLLAWAGSLVFLTFGLSRIRRFR